MKKSFLFALLFFFAAKSFALVGPTATVTTYLGAGGGGISGAGSYGAMSTGGGGMILLGALAIGTVVGYYAVEALAGDKFKIQASDLPQSPPPPPAAAPSTPLVTQYNFFNPYYTFEQNQCIVALFGTVTGEFGSAAEVCAAAGGTYNSGYCSKTGPCLAVGPDTYPLSATFSAAPACPPGYTGGGGSCTLVNARLATDDLSCDVLLNAGQFGHAADMNCPSTATGEVLTPLIRGNSTIGYGVNSSGQPLMFEVSNLQNVTYIREYQQSTVAGQSQVQTYEVAINATTGQVISVSSTVAPGSIAAPTVGTAVPTAQPTATPETTPTVTTNAGQPVQQQMPTFPTDYARTGEAQTASDSLKPEIVAIKDSLKNTENVDDPTPGQWSDPWGNNFDALKGWALPAHTSQCPTGSFQWPFQPFQTITIDTHCQLAMDHFPVVSMVMIAVWSILGLRVVLKA